ncbi:MAG TPA: NAD(P)H-hydrate dehydratase [Opitutaceae bacterium]|nr:NAD(P)H-hydrate dehydratase [Opitutaceae bacterium]
MTSLQPSQTSVPVLSFEETKRFENGLLRNPDAEWKAMVHAGRGIGAAVLRDAEEIGGLGRQPRLLVLAGKGHNGGDALIAAQALLEYLPLAHAEVVLAFGERAMRPLALRAWRDLQGAFPERVLRRVDVHSLGPGYDVCLDGIFGFQFRPPLSPSVDQILKLVNDLPIQMRVAVDLPSGLGAANTFRADFTYATGIVKKPVLTLPQAGRIRFIDLGWRPVTSAENDLPEEILLPELLRPFSAFRPVQGDKRTYGHLGVIGGSREFPGAVLMAVRAALRSGVGLLTAFVPESLVPAFAAAVPEAMWVGWPETERGGLALEGLHRLDERLPRLSALMLGPGLGRERETLSCVQESVRRVSLPIVLDADALQPEIVAAAKSVKILTPHAGEFARIAGQRDLVTAAHDLSATVVMKGPLTRISDGKKVSYALAGGPILARGGSGDHLAGIVGGLLAQVPSESYLAACRGVLWHGLAADAWTRHLGAVAVTSTQLVEYMPEVLRAVR